MIKERARQIIISLMKDNRHSSYTRFLILDEDDMMHSLIYPFTGYFGNISFNSREIHKVFDECYELVSKHREEKEGLHPEDLPILNHIGTDRFVAITKKRDGTLIIESDNFIYDDEVYKGTIRDH